MAPGYLRLLLNMYTTRISWNGVCSQTFSVENGVKRDGIVSPVLFCLYELLQSLRESKVGCYIGNVYSGALSHTDDCSTCSNSQSHAHAVEYM